MGLFDKIKGSLSGSGESEVDPFAPAARFDTEKVDIEKRAGIIDEHYHEISPDEAKQIAKILKENMTNENEYTRDDLSEEVENAVGLSSDFADRVVWNECASIELSTTVGNYIHQMNEAGEDWKFYVSGSNDDRSHPIRVEAVEETNPFEGGDPLPIDELHDLLKSKAEKYQDEGGTPERMDHWVPHEKPRLSIVRMPGS